MTREEQILNKAIDYSEIEENYLEYDDCGDTCNDKSFIENAFKAGAKWADKTMVDKAVRWMGNIDFDMSYWNPEEGFLTGNFMDDFRKAMEE